MMARPDVVCLSSQDWADVWTRKQRFMRRLARQGHRVLYVELQASWISQSILRKDWRRAFRWLKGPRLVEPNLYVGTLPLAVPCFQMSLGINAVNNAMMRRVLRSWIARLNFKNPVLWTYNAYSDGLVGRLGESCAVYECVDEFSASHGLVRAEVVQALERRVLAAVDMVIVTHENLLHSKKPYARAIELIPNAAELDHFARVLSPATPVARDVAELPRPVIGVVGTLQYWIDFDLIRYLAENRPDWSFVLVGPRGRLARTDKVQDCANVHLLGRRPYDLLPTYVKGFDVCLNPYVLDGTALNCSPLKLYEYLASGKPVVSVDMPEARRFGSAVLIGTTYDELLAKLEQALEPAESGPAASAARMFAVAPHSWEARFQQMEAALWRTYRRERRESEANTFRVPSSAARHE
jgi:glycosyltransferase involved in cell wall biosynthesis